MCEKMLDWSQSREAATVPLASVGRISLGTPIMSSIPVPENGDRVFGSGLKSRIRDIPLELRRLMTVAGSGRFVATVP